MRISEMSVRRPVLAIVISLLLIIFGLVSLERLSTREYPDIDRPVVTLAAEERRITRSFSQCEREAGVYR